MKLNKELKNKIEILVGAAIDCGAIGRKEGESLRQTDPLLALTELIDLSYCVVNRQLRDALTEHEQEIIEIACYDDGTASVIADLLDDMSRLVEAFNDAIHQARANRHRINPAKLTGMFGQYAQMALDQMKITDADLIKRAIEVAAFCFAQFAEHALQFTPSMARCDDPSAGPKIWMLAGQQNRDLVALSPVRYEWPPEADFMIRQQLNCDEKTLRMALMCLQNPFKRCIEGVREPFPFASVEGRKHPENWPQWPPGHGPYVMQPPGFLYEFLNAVWIGAELTNGS